MSTKSQKTEDMLDQTFANFDTEVTGAETQQAPAGGKAKSGDGAKKSSNMMVFVGAGIAAVGAVAYLFVVKPMLEQPAPQSVKPIKPLAAAPEQEKVTEVAPAQVNDPLTANQANQDQVNDPLAQLNQGQVTDPLAQANQGQVNDPLAQANQANVNEQLAQTQEHANDPLAQLNQGQVNTTTPVVAPIAQQNQVAPVNPPVVKTEVTVTQPQVVTSANVQSVAVVDELKNMFDKQSNEFKTVLTDIDTRVVGIESAINEQKNVNNKFDQRITALEGNKPVVNQVKKSSATKSNVVRTKKKAAVVDKKNDNAVLVDKSSEVKSKTEKVEKVSLPNVSLHSIYAGRLWVKNSDGSLSTYSAGDKLATGEVIKSIDDENFSVTTDKRVIKH